MIRIIVDAGAHIGVWRRTSALSFETQLLSLTQRRYNGWPFSIPSLSIEREYVE